MPPRTGSWIAAGGLQGVAASTTTAVIALLSLLAVTVLVYGFVRAIMMNRRTQIVVADLVAPSGSSELVEATMLSSLLRHGVERQVNDQRKQITRIGKTILTPAYRELEPQLDERAVEHIQSAASDSIATLSAALRAVGPETADRFLGLFSAILPSPRGLSVSAVLLQRGTNAAPRLGVAVEVVGLDRRPLASTVFWEAPATSSPHSSAHDGVSERFLSLFEPLARWIAVRLVVTLMVSARRDATSRARQALRRLLAGGLFLAAMRDFPAHALAFGEQACDELDQARRLIPGVPLPVETLAGVRERMGWARQLAGNSSGASEDFRSAVGLWEKAEDLIREDTSEANKTKLARILDRRLKAQLETDEPALHRIALTGLQSLTLPADLRSNCGFLYNRSCLYAQANRVDTLGDYKQQALHWLGLAIVCDPGLADYAPQDPVLAPIHEKIHSFLDCLHRLMSQGNAQHDEANIETFIAQAIAQARAHCD